MSFRRVLTAAAFIIVTCVFAGQLRQLLADPSIWPPDDFVEYWAAAKLTREGQNPYDPSLLLPLQQFAGRKTDEAVMMWNPPWSLAVVLPLGLMRPREAQLVWLAVNLLASIYCGMRLWLLLGGSRNRKWIGSVIALVALPTAFALQSGQISLLLLLGAVLFLECQRRGWQFCAGSTTVLLAIKPHLAYLIWAAILVDALVRGSSRVLLGGIVAGILCTCVPLAFNQQVLHQYADAMVNRPPKQWISPTIGTVLRRAFGEELFLLQFIPVALGLLWFIWHCRRFYTPMVVNRQVWDWSNQLPLLLLVSFVTAPYGAWPFDMVLLLPAVIWLIIHTQRPTRVTVIVGLVAVNLGCLVLNRLAITSDWFFWVSPAVLAIYSLAQMNRIDSSTPTIEKSNTTDRALVTA